MIRLTSGDALPVGQLAPVRVLRMPIRGPMFQRPESPRERLDRAIRFHHQRMYSLGLRRRPHVARQREGRTTRRSSSRTIRRTSSKSPPGEQPPPPGRPQARRRVSSTSGIGGAR